MYVLFEKKILRRSNWTNHAMDADYTKYQIGQSSAHVLKWGL